MRFSVAAAATALFGVLGSAAPAPQSTGAPDPSQYENIDISDFSVRFPYGSNGTENIQSVYFKLSGNNATDLGCEALNPALPSEVYTCGESKYRFSLKAGNETQYGLIIYHELGFAFGWWGEGDVPSYCHAGGNESELCVQTNPTTIVIDAHWA